MTVAGAEMTFAANTPDNFNSNTNASSLTLNTNWSTGAVPGAGNDAVFTAADPTTAASYNFYIPGVTTTVFGSLDDVNTNAITISNNLSSAASTLTLGGGTGNATTNSSSSDLIYVASGSTLNLSNTGTGTLSLALGQGGNFDIAGTSVISCPISGAFALASTGAGSLNLSGTSSFTGGLTVSAGTLTLAAGTDGYTGGTTISGGLLISQHSAAMNLTGTVNLNAGTFEYTGGTGGTMSNAFVLGSSSSTILIPASNSITFSGAITGSGTLNKTGAGTLILSNTTSNTYAGTVVSAGILQVASIASIPAGSTTTLNGGTFAYGGTTASTANLSATDGFALGASGGTMSNADTNAITFVVQGTVTGTGNVLTINPTYGIVSLDNSSNSYGSTNVAGGTFEVQTSGAAGTGQISLASGTTLQLYDHTLGTYTPTLSNAVSLAGNATITTSTQNWTIAGVISSTSTSTLTKTGSGTLILGAITTISGTNYYTPETYTGGTNVTGGTLEFPSTSIIPATGTISLAAGTTFEYYNTATVASTPVAIALTGTSGGTGTIYLPGGSTANASQVFSENGVISGTGTLVKTGVATLLLSSTNTYSGGTTISAGAVTATNASALGTGNVVNNSTLNIGSGSPVALNIGSGTYTQATTAALSLQVSSSSVYSSLQTTGTASVGGTLNINVGSAAVADGVKFQVLNTGGVTGNFSAYTTNTLPAGVMVDTSNVEKTGQLALVSYFNGFETVNGVSTAASFSQPVNSYVLGSSATSYGTVTQVVNAANASSNAAYARIAPTKNVTASLDGVNSFTANVGPATFFGGASSSFGTGFTTQVDVYINPAWTGTANGTGFDYSSAVSTNTGAFDRDFILHTFSAGGKLYVSADSNSDYKADPNYLTSDPTAQQISTAGWYTVQDTFYNNGSGVLAVNVKLFAAGSSTPIFSQVISNAADNLTGIGGNNYAWFVNIDTGDGTDDGLNIDNVKLIDNTGSGLSAPAITQGTTLVGNSVIAGAAASFNIGGTNPGGITSGYDLTNVVDGDATLGGDLAVTLVNGFESQITPSDVFDVIEADGIDGSFGNVVDGQRVETADGSGSFVANYVTNDGITSLQLTDFQAGSVPEPASIGLLTIGTGALLGRRRRHK